MKLKFFIIAGGIIAVLALLATVYFLFLNPHTPARFVPTSPYASTSSAYEPSKETVLKLDDGAQLIIGPSALSGAATITFERNPPKTDAFPDLPDTVTPLSDFYNSTIEGASLLSNVEYILPFNPALIPDDQADGFLVALFPSEAGWELVPVESRGSLVILVTDQIGDPLIGWHFGACSNRFEKNPDVIRQCEEYKQRLAERAICAPTIPINMTLLDDGSGFEITGRLSPVSSTYLGFPRKPAASQTVHVYINKTRPLTATMNKLILTTDENGYFNAVLYTRDTDSDLVENAMNYAHASAKCEEWPGEVSVLSKGWANAYLPVPGTAAPETTPEYIDPSIQPVPPDDNRIWVEVPNVVGKMESDASSILANLGIQATIKKVKSFGETGTVISQKPVAGMLIDPYQTPVLVYIVGESTGGTEPTGFLQQFGHANYTCTSYTGQSYHSDVPIVIDGCGNMAFQVVNKDGVLTKTWTERDGSSETIEIGAIANLPMEKPIFGFLSLGHHFWWLPSLEKNYTYDGWTTESVRDDYTRVDTQTSKTYAPGEKTVITVAGREFSSIIYTTEYTSEFRETWKNGVFQHQTFSFKIVDTYDAATGMLLRSEAYSTWGPCETNNQFLPVCAANAMQGRTSIIIIELSETDLP